MGIQSASATFTRFFVPEAPVSDFWSYVDEKIRSGSFRENDEGQEVATGFASWDDFFDSTFEYGSYHKGEYVAFTFRVDQRKVPAVIKKQYVRQGVQKYRDENDGKWPSRRERQEIQENVQSWLLNRALPQPSACEVVWNPAKKWMLVGTTSTKMVQTLLEHFENHFRLYPVPLYHVHWALNMVPLEGRLRDALSSMVSVKSSQALEEGRFLGHEFLTWLWYLIEKGGERVQVAENLFMEVHLGERLVLTLPGASKEKVVCTTQANSLHEARTALQQGKLVEEIQVLFRIADNEYLFTLDSTLWAIKGLRAPKQLPDYDKEDLDGRFLERMYFLEEVLGALGVLYGLFLGQRLSPGWESDALPRMREWIGEVTQSGDPAGGSPGEEQAPF
jgi:hypothetical protein